MGKKRICMIVPSFGAKGGIASVVSGYRGSELEKRYEIHYIETYCDGGKGAKLRKALSAYAQFAKELLVCRPELIHVHSSFGASFYRKLPFLYGARLFGIPVVNQIHGSELDVFYRNAGTFEKKIKKDALGKCAAVVTLSPYWKEQFSEIVPKEKIFVVENYSVLQTRREDWLQKGNQVLFLGFLKQLKGCFDIPEVISLTVKQCPEAMFLLAGSGSEEDIAIIRQKLDDCGVAEHCRFPGWVRGPQKEMLLREADVFFLPSYTEGMPMSILEAMGYGLPVVSTTVGGIPQLVQNGQNGFLTEPGDTKAMAEALIAVLQDREKRVAMGNRSQAIIREGYSLERHIAALTEIYEHIITAKERI